MSAVPRRATAAPQIISGVSPELTSLIKAFDLLPSASWPALREIRDQHGSESAIGKTVEQIYAGSETGFKRAVQAIFAFPACSPADLAAKLAFVSRPYVLLMNYKVALASALADAMRLAKPGPSDEALLALAGDAEAAYEVAKIFWQRFRAERETHEIDPSRPPVPSRFYTEANEAAKKTGRLASAVFGCKAHTIQGVLAKLRLVELAYGTGDGSTNPPDLEAYQRGSWLGSTIKDLDRLAGVS